jgi:hypothetical protein
VARAGFWAVSSGKISFRSDGRWYSDDEPINNARIALLFSKCLRRTEDGRWQIAMADERAFVDVEDTPWVVTGVRGSAASGWHLRLNDGSEEALDPRTLTSAASHVLYADVKDGQHRARFLRPAYYELARAFEEHDGDVVLVSDGERFPIAAAR